MIHLLLCLDYIFYLGIPKRGYISTVLLHISKGYDTFSNKHIFFSFCWTFCIQWDLIVIRLLKDYVVHNSKWWVHSMNFCLSDSRSKHHSIYLSTHQHWFYFCFYWFSFILKNGVLHTHMGAMPIHTLATIPIVTLLPYIVMSQLTWLTCTLLFTWFLCHGFYW